MLLLACLLQISVFLGGISDVSTAAPGDLSSSWKSAMMNIKKTDCYCGTVSSAAVGQDYILQGEEADIGDIPWMVKLMKDKKWASCGGTLVGSRHVVTAAHCVPEKIEEGWTVHLGVIDKSDSGLEIPVKEIIRHNNYSETGTMENDIAVLVLSEQVDWQVHPNIRPACLPNSKSITDFVNKKATISGWGYIQEKNTYPTILQKAEVIVTGNNCSAYQQKEILPGMFCAGDKNEAGKNIDSCAGDSGGPLTVEDKGAHSLIGVVSWGEGCGTEGYPGVYTDVPYYFETKWLSNALTGLDTCPPPGANEPTPGPTTSTTSTSTTRTTTACPPCQDMDEERCAYYSRYNCWNPVVRKFCQKSCGFCSDKTPTESTTRASKRCRDGDEKWCAYNAYFYCSVPHIRKFCQKSCGVCYEK